MRQTDHPADMSTQDMVTDLWKWAFGNGKRGVEDRLSTLEDLQVENATRQDLRILESRIDNRIGRVEDKIDKLNKSLNIHEMIRLAVIVGTVVASARGLFG